MAARADHLRSHVLDGAAHGEEAAVGGGALGEAEVDEHHGARGDEDDVVRLEVSEGPEAPVQLGQCRDEARRVL